MNEMVIRNRQRVRRVNVTLLRQITKTMLNDLLNVKEHELGIHLIAAPEMVLLNETFLQHEGSTDVITFDHANVGQASRLSQTSKQLISDRRDACPTLHGEIFISIDDAIKQTLQFRTTWQSELARYVIHGILHLLGHDDLNPAARRRMKREENRLLREITRRFPIADLAKSSYQRVNRKS